MVLLYCILLLPVRPEKKPRGEFAAGLKAEVLFLTLVQTNPNKPYR